MRLPRVALLCACAVLTTAAYYLILVAQWASVYGRSYAHAVIADAVAVAAAAACVEVMRSEKSQPLRALAGAVGVPLVLVIALTFWYGVRRYFQV